MLDEYQLEKAPNRGKGPIIATLRGAATRREGQAGVDHYSLAQPTLSYSLTGVCSLPNVPTHSVAWQRLAPTILTPFLYPASASVSLSGKWVHSFCFPGILGTMGFTRTEGREAVLFWLDTHRAPGPVPSVIRLLTSSPSQMV